ncbi:MAG TPA: AAA family ATPase, partial [Steroidobacteraceae bacterium]|nr:AAA family ATPase [Steroidobacteraceae bacterium]
MELLERQSQLDELTQYLREAEAGSGKVAFVVGEAGAGKSALVEAFAAQLSRGARVVWGACDALQTPRALGPVHEVASALTVASAGSDLAEQSRPQLFARLVDELARRDRFTVVVLEDLHWADEATLDFVRYVGRRIQRTRCLLIATYRDDELAATHPLRRMLGEITGRHTTRIRVPPLSLAAVTRLAEGGPRNVERIYEVTGGNAFFVREVLAASRDVLPETVRDAVIARLMQCSPGARELAQLVSLSPGKTELWLAASILSAPGPLIEEGVARGLLRAGEDSLAFRHELARLAVETTVPPARAQDLHQRILAALRERGADLSELVHHAQRARDVGAIRECAPRAG